MRLSIAALLLFATISVSAQEDFRRDPPVLPLPPEDIMVSQALRYQRGSLHILDHHKLPHEKEWIEVQGPEQMADLIVSLKVRGDPLISVAAALLLSQMAVKKASIEELEKAAVLLKNARPSSVHLTNCVDRVLIAMRTQHNSQKAVIQTARAIFLENVSLLQ